MDRPDAAKWRPSVRYLGWPRWPVYPDRGQRHVPVRAHAPRVEEQSGQIAAVVDMQVGEENGVKAREVQARVRECRWRSAAAVNGEEAAVRRDSRGYSPGTGGRHRRARPPARRGPLA